jgi:hypothetical protein
MLARLSESGWGSWIRIELCVFRRIKKFVQSLMSLKALAPVLSSISYVSPQSTSCSKNSAIRPQVSGRTTSHSKMDCSNLKVMGSNTVPATTFVIILLPFWSKRRDGRAFFRMQGGRLIRSSSGRDNAVETAASIPLRLITLPNGRLRFDPTTTALQGQDQGAGTLRTPPPEGEIST